MLDDDDADFLDGEPAGSETLPLVGEELFQHVCRNFTAMLTLGRRVDIEDVLKETRVKNHTTLLGQLILVELEHRWGRGETPSLEEYLERFPAASETIKGLVPEIERLARSFSIALVETVVKPEVIKKLGHFEIRTELGRGSFGVVWLAYDTRMKRHVAIKTISHFGESVQNQQLAIHEAQAVSRLIHPNIIQIFDVEEIDDTLCLVCEYINGINLGKELENGMLDFKKSAYICQKIAEALHYAHTNKIIHRDVKPANIMINAAGEPKLADFGIAKYAHAEKTLSNDGKIIGTVRYMSPEQSRTADLDGRSDVYSLGVVLYELLTGKPPFKGTLKEIMFCHQFRDPHSPRALDKRIPRELETICLKALSKSVTDRYESSMAMAEDLAAYLDQRPITALPMHPAKRVWRRMKRRPLFTSMVFLAIAAATSSAALGAILLQKDDPRERGRWNVYITTNPPGARILLHELDPKTGEVLKNKRFTSDPRVTPTTLELPPGRYNVIAKLDDGSERFNEVMRTVPDVNPGVALPYHEDNWKRKDTYTIAWPLINISSTDFIKNELIYIKGTPAFHVGEEGNDLNPKRIVRIDDFYVSAYEFSIGDHQKLRSKYATRYSDIGRLATDAYSPESRPAASHWAEEFGCRLPTEEEFEYLSGQIKIPILDSKEWDVNSNGIYAWDRLPVTSGKEIKEIVGLLSGKAEWTSSPSTLSNAYRAHFRTVDFEEFGIARGGSRETLNTFPHQSTNITPKSSLKIILHDTYPGLGFRLFKSSKPSR